jgi:predicted O-linked N-acetylglucosamine transferase (SPINDLY family)
MSAIDYLLSDDALIPPDSRGLFTETIYDLPGFMAFAPPAESPALTPPPAEANGFVTFGSMNRLTKINDAVLAAWGDILMRLPGARLLAKDPAFDDAPARAHVLDFLASRRVAAQRIELRGKTSRRAHLAAYAEIDVALDPFPQSGGITTFEALWMGVPVITLAGERPQARASASILSGIGLDEAIATSVDGYVGNAVAWAAGVQGLRTVRAGLRDRLRGSLFCNHAAYSAAVEGAYRAFWWRWCNSR